MTKLPLLAGAFMISTILSPVGAIDVNIPGADSKIPKDAYVNYQATNPDIEKDVVNYVETLKATDKAKTVLVKTKLSMLKQPLYIAVNITIIQSSPFMINTTKFGFHSPLQA